MGITASSRLRMSFAVLALVGASLMLEGCAGVSAGPNSKVTNPDPTAGTLTAAPATLAFGNVAVGSVASLTGTLSATTADVSVASASLSGSGYAISGITLPVT